MEVSNREPLKIPVVRPGDKVLSGKDVFEILHVWRQKGNFVEVEMRNIHTKKSYELPYQYVFEKIRDKNITLI